MTDAFTWPSLFRHSLKCLLNLSLREQPLLPMLDVFNVGWVRKEYALLKERATTATHAGCVQCGLGRKGIRPSQSATQDPAYYSCTSMGSLQTRSPLLSSKPITKHSSSSYRRPTAHLHTSE